MAFSGLVDSKGRPLQTGVINKKEAAPATGNAYGHWAGRDIEYLQLPGGGIVQFDLSKLKLSDFRQMRDHYQVNASLSVLSFMQHQSDWHIEHEDAKVRDFCTEQLANNWTMLNRTMAQSNWAGFSPGVLEWENEGSRVVLDKVKDLIPEECDVNWKTVEGYAPPGRTAPKFHVYDGIKQIGQPWPIPVENTFWYPILMENGDYYGRKLLRAAFQSWFFSILMHLFSNRYFERFGEPVPIGRAPFDEAIAVDGEEVTGNTYMLKVLQDLRNRSVVVLPNDRTEDSAGRSSFDYELEYLESQMRGADFERYMTRLDEEISLALFTPLLLMRTADVGSYNLGVGHMQVYLWMLNAMNDDRKIYIDKYLLNKMKGYNFSKNGPSPKIVFRKLGSAGAEMLKEVITALIQGNKAIPNLEEIGQMAGMTLEAVRQTVSEPEPTPDPDADPEGVPDAPADDRATVTGGRAVPGPRAVVKEIVARVRPQIENAYKDGTMGPDLKVNMGFKRRLERAFANDGLENWSMLADHFYNGMDAWLEGVVCFGKEFDSDSFMDMFERATEKFLPGLYLDAPAP